MFDHFLCPSQPGEFQHLTDLRCSSNLETILRRFERFISYLKAILSWFGLFRQSNFSLKYLIQFSAESLLAAVAAEPVTAAAAVIAINRTLLLFSYEDSRFY